MASRFPVFSSWVIFMIAIAAYKNTHANDDTPSAEETQSLRVAPLEPAEAVRSFEVLDGFEMQLVAHEPHNGEARCCGGLTG